MWLKGGGWTLDRMTVSHSVAPSVLSGHKDSVSLLLVCPNTPRTASSFPAGGPAVLRGGK